MTSPRNPIPILIVLFLLCFAIGESSCRKAVQYTHDFNRMAWNTQFYYKDYILNNYYTQDTTIYGLDTFAVQVISNSSIIVLGSTLDYTSSTDSTLLFLEEHVPQGPYSRMTLYYNYKANSIHVQYEDYITHQLDYTADYTTP